MTQPQTNLVTVVIPVGPNLAHRQWLDAAIQSVWDQTIEVADILLIDDMAAIPGLDAAPTEHVTAHRHPLLFIDNVDSPYDQCYAWRAPWRLGVAHAFNVGVALAPTELVFMLGADDTMEPTCLERALEAYEKNKRQDAYYYVGIRYTDTGELQSEPCGEAMVTKGLWRKTGGFPVESAVGAPDCALISVMMVHMADRLVPVADGAPLVNYRRHADTDTATRPVAWQGPILSSRDILTTTWKQPAWGRYA